MSYEDAELASGPAQNYDYSLVLCLNEILTESQPFPRNGAAVDLTFVDGEFRFKSAILMKNYCRYTTKCKDSIPLSMYWYYEPLISS